MAATIDAQLVEAVEKGRAVEVRRLIDAGANPDARKQMTMGALVVTGKRLVRVKVRSNLFREDDFEEKFEEVVEAKSDTVDCESALTIAILHGHVDCVAALLEMGAKVDGPADWKFGNVGPETTAWSSDSWEKERWSGTVSFPSPLCLAVGRGGKVQWWNGDIVVSPDNSGKVPTNPRGGRVALNSPTKMDDIRIMLKLSPRPEIVQLLLSHGASVTATELSAVKTFPDLRILRIVEGHVSKNGLKSPPSAAFAQRVPRPLQPVNSSSSLSATTVNSSRTSSDNPIPYMKRVDSLVGFISSVRTDQTSTSGADSPGALLGSSFLQDSRLLLNGPDPQQRISALEKDLLISQRDNANFTNQISQLKQEQSALMCRITELEGLNTHLISRNSDLEEENAALRIWNGQQSKPPVALKQMLFVVADFDPRNADELQLRVGNEVFVNLAFADGWASVSSLFLILHPKHHH
ncbi:hypothetical protein M427DRAFT_251265 [Gonapodya prolifera JEL478]|uniref:Uncharacterized protein n=1 Tax=Gonapodya prolifera (strain JEL478) TaxID=1344416 RepID=A0A138ZX67_GONPJ|nr:hypothetical protein M427DRAFT_251265 [Gonapodya prolifera JEL478]|eukprot:KXS09108.1 hypothetical protein M427DRAFT_251265 [Gonapodya prolifera JEL478]